MIQTPLTREELRSALRKIIKEHVGLENAIEAMALAEMFGFRDDRPIRQAIEELIVKEHFPCCSSTEKPPGYFFPRSAEEAEAACKPLQKRAVKIFLRKRRIVRDAFEYYENLRRQAEVPVHQERLL